MCFWTSFVLCVTISVAMLSLQVVRFVAGDWVVSTDRCVSTLLVPVWQCLKLNMLACAWTIYLTARWLVRMGAASLFLMFLVLWSCHEWIGFYRALLLHHSTPTQCVGGGQSLAFVPVAKRNICFGTLRKAWKKQALDNKLGGGCSHSDGKRAVKEHPTFTPNGLSFGIWFAGFSICRPGINESLGITGTRKPDVALLSPGFSPTVANQPTVLGVAHCLDAMIQNGAVVLAAAGENATSI